MKLLSQITTNNYLLYIAITVFIALNSYLFTLNIYIGAVLPVVLLFVYWAVFNFKIVWYAVVLFTPVSIPLTELIDLGGLNLLVPTEPILIGIFVVFILRFVDEFKLNADFLKHPLSLAIGFYFFWILFTSISSTLPLVSLKFTLNRAWYIIAFYVLGSLFLTNSRQILIFVKLYLFPLALLILYATYLLSEHGFSNQKAANWVMHPFFNDHTAYGAAIAFYIPIAAIIFYIEKKAILKFVYLMVLAILFIGLVFSYSRAAWISLTVAVGFGALLYVGIRFKHLLIAGGIFVAFLLAFGTSLVMKLEKNKQDSSGDFAEHIQSMSNIRSDASNLERLNRWSCAIQLFEEKPLLGWGPGTYQFVYAPYQLSYNRTIISTNLGTGGTAHSEYLGPLAETGIIGALSVISLLLMSIAYGMKAFYRLKNRNDKLILAGILSGFAGYWVHGILNNFLDTDKISVPFWGFLAIITLFNLSAKEKMKIDSK